MQSKTAAIAVYILSLFLPGMACLLDNIASFLTTTESGELWVKFLARTCCYRPN